MKAKKKNKTYLKASCLYEKGELDKAVKLCDECISTDLKNKSALNLKGLILYIKGDLKEARNQWKINADYNDDSIAKNYLFDSIKDAERLKLYREAVQDIKAVRINEALKKLSICRESDFNSIKVNMALAECYFKKGDYINCSVYVSNVLSTDKNNAEAKKMAKDLKKYDNIKLEAVSGNGYLRYILTILALLCFVVIGGFAVNFIIQNKEISTEVSQSDENEDKLQEEIEENVQEEVNDKEDKGETNVENKINFSELSNSINEKKYDDVYNKLQAIKPDSLSGSEKSIYYNGKQLLEKEGVDYFYKKGYELYINKSYSEASVQFTKGCTYGKDNYLYPHLIFFNAACYEAAGNPDEAIKYYEEYYRRFHNSDYIAETVYKLALLYKDKDMDKAEAYAEEIRENYSSSMYNNDVISDLIDSVK